MHKIVKWVLVILMTLGMIVLFLTPTPDNIQSPTPEAPPAPGAPLYTPPAVDEDVLEGTRSATAEAQARHEAMLTSVRDATAEAASALSGRRDQATADAPEVGAYDGSDELSVMVYAGIREAQQHLMTEQWEAAVNELNALYAYYEQLNHFEQRTLLNFYSNALLGLRMYEEAIVLFEQSLTVPAPDGGDERSRPRLALGQLYAGMGEHQAAVQHLSAWMLEFAEWEQMAGATESVLHLLADSYVQLEQYALAEPALEAHIRMREADQRQVQDEVYVLREQIRSLQR